MKLHLPSRLRAALLACTAVVSPLLTTIGTGTLAASALLAPGIASAETAETGGTYVVNTDNLSTFSWTADAVVAANTISFEGVEYAWGGYAANKAKDVIIGVGSTISTTHNGENAFFGNGHTATILGGGTLLTSGGDSLGYSNSGTVLELRGTNSETRATWNLANRATTSITLKLNGYTRIGTAGDGQTATIDGQTRDIRGLDMLNGTISVTGTDNIISCAVMTRENRANISVGENASLRLEGAFFHRNGAAHPVTKSGAGLWELAGDYNRFAGALNVTGGTVRLLTDTRTDGAITLSANSSLEVGADATLTLSNAVGGESARLVLNGNVVVGSSALISSMELSGGDEGYLSALRLAGSGVTTTLGENTTVQILGADYSGADLQTNGGGLVVTDSAQDGVYYLAVSKDYNADTMGGDRTLVVLDGAVLSTTDLSVLSRVSSTANGAVRYTSASGTGLQFSGLAGQAFNTTQDETNPDTLLAAGNSGFVGNITILSGTTLKMNSSLSDADAKDPDALGVIYMANKDRAITIQSGATLDLNGHDAYFHVVMEGGSVLTNSGADVATGHKALPYLELLGDATIDAAHNIVMQKATADSGGVYQVKLNGNTLTKTGSGKLYLASVSFVNGSLDIREGILHMTSGSSSTLNSLSVGSACQEICLDNANLTVSGSTVSEGTLKKTGGSALNLNGSVTLGTGFDGSAAATAFHLTNGTVTLAANQEMRVAGAIQMAGGTLKINGSLVVTRLDTLSTTSTLPTSNGLGTATYTLVTGTNKANLKNAQDETLTTIYVGGVETTLSDGAFTLNNVYYVLSDTVQVGGENATTDTESASLFSVASGATLLVAGNASESMNADRVLAATIGSGDIELSTTATVYHNQATRTTGELRVLTGGELRLGVETNQGGVTHTTSCDVSSLSALVLDGGTLYVRGVSGTLGDVRVKTGSTSSKLHIYDMQNVSNDRLVLDSLQVDADLTIYNTWKMNVSVGVLTGAGNLSIEHEQSGDSDLALIDLGSLGRYTGNIELKGRGNGVAATAHLDEGESYDISGLTKAGSSSLTVSGAGTLKLTTSDTLQATLGANWTGAVAADGVSVVSTVSTAAWQNASSRVSLKDVSVAAGGGALTLGGTVKLLSSIANAGSISYAEGLELDVSALTATDDGRTLTYTLITGEGSIEGSLTLDQITGLAEVPVGESGWVVADDYKTVYRSIVDPSVLVINSAHTYDQDDANNAAVTSIRLAGGTLSMADVAIPSAVTTLDVTAAGGALTGTGTVNTLSFGSVNVNGQLTLQDGATDLTLEVVANQINIGSSGSIVLESGQTLYLKNGDNIGAGQGLEATLGKVSGEGTIQVDGGTAWGDPMRVQLRNLTTGTLQTNVNINVKTNSLAINGWNAASNTVLEVNKDFTVADQLRLETGAQLRVVDGGALTAKTINLGHAEAGNSAYLSMTGGSITTEHIGITNSGSSTFTMSGGTLTINTTAGIASGIGITITGGTLATNGADWGMSNATIGGATISGENTISLGGNTTLTGTLDNSAGKLALSGSVNISDTGAFQTQSTTTGYSDGAKQGFASQDVNYIIAVDGSPIAEDGSTGHLSIAEGTTWTVNGETTANGSLVDLDGSKAYRVTGVQGTAFYIGTNDVTYDT
ncbi:MAG: beta strand repeat-containing protein, partial [Akkermansia sp.]